MKKCNFKTAKDQKMLDRQRVIVLHYADIAINQKLLESSAITERENKDLLTDNFLNW